MFSMPVYSFNEGSGTGSVTIVKVGQVSFPFNVSVSGGKSQLTVCIYVVFCFIKAMNVSLFVYPQVPVLRQASRSMQVVLTAQ